MTFKTINALNMLGNISLKVMCFDNIQGGGGGGGGQHFAHKKHQLQFLDNKYAVGFYKSYQNEKRFLKL